MISFLLVYAIKHKLLKSVNLIEKLVAFKVSIDKNHKIKINK
jgi:hypothetical protein